MRLRQPRPVPRGVVDGHGRVRSGTVCHHHLLQHGYYRHSEEKREPGVIPGSGEHRGSEIHSQDHPDVAHGLNDFRGFHDSAHDLLHR